MLVGPAGDRAGAGDHLAAVEHEDRHLVGAAELLDLGAVILTAAPGPGHQPVAADGLELILVAGRVKRLTRLGAGMGEGGPGLLLSAGVEDHRLSLPQTESAARASAAARSPHWMAP